MTSPVPGFPSIGEIAGEGKILILVWAIPVAILVWTTIATISWCQNVTSKLDEINIKLDVIVRNWDDQ